MGITAEDIIALRRTIDIDAGPIGFPGEVVKLTYRPNYFDEDAEQVQKHYQESKDLLEPMYGMFLSAVVAWDVLKSKKTTETVPLTMQGLKEARIALPVITYLWVKLLEDYRLGEKSADAGSAGSQAPAKSETLPQTGSGSESPTTSTTAPSGS